MLQEVFNTVVTHLLTQNEKALIKPENSLSQCAYRNNEGLKCAIGCLINSKDYSPDMEKKSAEFILAQFQFKHSPYMAFLKKHYKEHSTFIYKLQTIHDTFPPDTWKERLQKVAKHFNLSFPITRGS